MSSFEIVAEFKIPYEFTMQEFLEQESMDWLLATCRGQDPEDPAAVLDLREERQGVQDAVARRHPTEEEGVFTARELQVVEPELHAVLLNQEELEELHLPRDLGGQVDGLLRQHLVELLPREEVAIQAPERRTCIPSY